MQGSLTLILAVVLLLGRPALGAPVFHDPADDTFGVPLVSHDISLIDSHLTPMTLEFTVGFDNTVSSPSAFSPNSVVGFIDIDVDQNTLTGAQSNKSRFSPHGDSQLGIEFFVDLFSERFHEGMAEVVETSSMQVVGTAPVVFDPTGLSVAVPLELLMDDGIVNYGVIVGDFLDMSDEAPNIGFALSIPEPASWGLWTLGVILFMAAPPLTRQRWGT